MAKAATQPAIIWVDPKLIEDPLHEVRPVDKEHPDYKALVARMKDEGFWAHKPLVCMAEGDHYVRTGGNNRLTAARELGLKLVPIAVTANMKPGQQLVRGLIDNHVIDMRPVDYARTFAKIINDPEFKGMTLVALAAKVGKTADFVTKRLGLAKLEGKAADLVNVGTIPIEGGVALQKLQSAGVTITDELLARAAREPVADFVADCKALIERKKGAKPALAFKLRPIGDVKNELARAEKDKKTKPGYVEALKWALRQDAASEAERKKR